LLLFGIVCLSWPLDAVMGTVSHFTWNVVTGILAVNFAFADDPKPSSLCFALQGIEPLLLRLLKILGGIKHP
jgi:hypothetical protein